MDKIQKKSKTKTTGENETGGKAARVRRMRKGNNKTAEVREENSERLFGERSVK